jgi:prevent-host-death family protein
MKRVNIAQLKARLSEYLREVKSGHPVTVMDRLTPVASLIPYAPTGEPLQARGPVGKYPTLQKVPLPPPMKRSVDIVAVLREERGER